MLNVLGFLIVAATLAVSYVFGRSWSVRRSALRRLYEQDDTPAGDSDSAMARWLSRAGYRRPNAPVVFATATVASILIGIGVSQFYRLVLLQRLSEAVAAIPGSTADVLIAVLRGGPWLLFLLTSIVPTLIVRARRRTRVRSIERDLPLALELFATMAEAGLGFDASLAKIIRAQSGKRPLSAEFLNFQHDMLAGIPRTQALRQLARRVDIQSLTTFTSALIQAEQVGASLAETLQHQADDLRHRRREMALLQAQALPVKLVFPLVICFLPGIFASTLAPVLYQVIQMANGVVGLGR